jgi:glycosyl transferase, family 25
MLSGRPSGRTPWDRTRIIGFNYAKIAKFHIIYAVNFDSPKCVRLEAVYVIHARKFADRAAHMASQMAKFQMPYELIEQFDPDAIEPATKSRFMPPDYPFSIGKFSCTLKHFEALRRIAARGHQCALVLEDDVVLDRNFNGELAKILEEAQTITRPYTIQIGSGGNMFTPKKRLQPGKRLYEADQVRATEAYVISAETARLRLEWLDRNQFRTSTDHLFNLIDREMGIACYWSEPAIAVQGSMNGMFHSSLDAGRSTRPLWYLKLRFGWQRLRRKYIYDLFR